MLVAVTDGDPRVLTIWDRRALPAGPFQFGHRSLQAGLRAWVEQQTHHPLGYVEQLYTFADHDRTASAGQHVISVSYLGLTRAAPAAGVAGEWRSWYHYLPWEDHRAGPPEVIAAQLLAPLRAWVESGPPASDRRQRVVLSFGLDGHVWNEELVLQRYELLYEAGLVAEHAMASGSGVGEAMLFDHRRILATAMARLRAKIKYRPVVFELMPAVFTLLQLQRCVEAIAGRLVHKQNFRRLIEQQELVEETGESTHETGGRPAKLFRFRREVLAERAIAGSKLPLVRS